MRGPRGRGLDALGGQRRQQLLGELRVAARRAVAGGREARRGLGLEPCAHERARSGRAERRQVDDARGGIGVQRGDELGRRPELEWAQRHGQHHRQPLETAGEVAQEPQRGGVGPVRVVDRDEQR